MSRVDWRKVIEAAKFFYGDEWWRFIAELKTMHHESERRAIEELLKRYEEAVGRGS